MKTVFQGNICASVCFNKAILNFWRCGSSISWYTDSILPKAGKFTQIFSMERITCHGDNDYAILHMQKEKRLCDGTLPNLRIPSDEALEVFDMMGGGAWEQWWHGRSTMMSTSPSIANDSTTLCFTRLGRRKLWSIVWCFTSLYRTIFYFIINLLGTAVILSWSTASASSPKNANRSSSCNREKHCETVSSMQSTFITMNIFSTVSFATYFVCVSFEEQVGHAA